MHTVIRYNRKGKKLVPIYWLVVQGHYKNRRGKYRENLGFWFPKKVSKNKQDRSLIINKNRARYWLSEGARVPKKATKHMSYFGLTTEPWISWGRKTIYDGGEREIDIRRDTLGEFESNYLDKEDEQRIREESMENVLLRRVKLKQRLLEEFEGKTHIEVVETLLLEEEGLEDDEDLLIRSSKYWALYKEYEIIERNLNIVHPMRKELLFKKLNRIAEQGFLDKDRVSYDNPFFSIFNKDGDNIKIEPHADKLKREIEEDMACKDIN